MKRVVAAIALGIVLATNASSPRAQAQTSGGGELGPDYVRATASDLGAGRFPGAGLPSASPATEPIYDWSRAVTGGRCVVFSGPVPPDLAASVSPLPGIVLFPYVPLQVGTLQGAPPGAMRLDGTAPLPPGATAAGAFVVDTATPRAGGPGVLVIPRCAAPGEPLPASMPTAADIWQQTPLPRAVLHASPPGTREWPGIVNLETHFWSAAPPDARALVTLDGYVVSVTAHPIAFGWAFGDGTVMVTPSPTSAGAPARATYRRRGDHDVGLYVVWAGLAHVTAPAWGLDFGTQYLGTVTLPVSRRYHVAEIRALLRSRTARG